MNDDFPIEKAVPIPAWAGWDDRVDKWTEDEDRYLRAHLGEIHFAKMAEWLGRTPQSTRKRIHDLGLRSEAKPGEYDLVPRPLTEKQARMAAIRLYVQQMRRTGMVLSEVGKRLGFTREYIRQLEDGSSKYRERVKARIKSAPKSCLPPFQNHLWEMGKCRRCGIDMNEGSTTWRYKQKIGLIK